MALIALLLLISVCVSQTRATEPGLIRAGEIWRFLPGTSEPPANWFATEFDDRAWAAAPAGFSFRLTDFYNEHTRLTNYGSQYRTVYFRKPFVLESPADLAQLILRIDYDDGFVAWINGAEVARRGVSGTPRELLPVSALAAVHPQGPTEEIDVSSAIPMLRAGTNVLAIQLLGSSTNDFLAAMAAELLANFTRGPFIQNNTTSSVQVIWKSASSLPAFIEFGTNRASAARLELSQVSTSHVATVTGLAPGTLYEYRAGLHFPAQDVVSPWSTFRTFKNSGPIVFDVVGDTGWSSQGQFDIARGLTDSHPDLVMHVGDMVYFAITQFSADLRFFSVYDRLFRSTPLFVALGNHEMYLDRAAALDCLYLPTNNVTGTEHFYSFDNGEAHFAVIWTDLFVGADYKPGSPQYQWLEADLAAATKPWKFMFFHQVWRSSSVHDLDDYDYNTEPDFEQLEAGPISLARKYGVQIVFNGHDHGYQRLMPGNGPMSFVSGGGGALLYPFSRLHPEMVQFYSRYNFLRVTVGSEEARIDAIADDESVFDSMTIRRDYPERRVRDASWHTPQFETAPADDGDGNVRGETFAFAGAPITPRLGQFTSTGRLHINNDGTNLYLGLDQMMVRTGEEVFVFIESPGLSGVTNMHGVGNGIVDPAGQGADGLDFLENLAFTNFGPAIGIILGDEFADAASPGFTRAGETISTGQGAFYLTSTASNSAGGPPVELAPIPGQRLAQFNHAPQDFPTLYEQNADFAQIALPLASLRVSPGDRIRIAAVVGRNGVLTDAGLQTRPIDVGGIATSMSQTDSETLVEPVEVQLAAAPAPDSGLHLGFTDKSGLALNWAAAPGAQYQIEYSDNAAGPFHDLLSPSLPRTAASTNETLNVSPDLARAARYYRLVRISP